MRRSRLEGPLVHYHGSGLQEAEGDTGDEYNRQYNTSSRYVLSKFPPNGPNRCA